MCHEKFIYFIGVNILALVKELKNNFLKKS